MKVYNKLIRDKIPQIIEESGSKSTIQKLDDKQYEQSLNEKLQEELNEFYQEDNISELADLVEVVHAIVLHKGYTIEEFEKVRLEKKEKRGGFEEKLFLVSVED